MIVKTGVMQSAASRRGRDAAKLPGLQSRALHPTKKYLAPNANTAKLKKLRKRNGRDREIDLQFAIDLQKERENAICLFKKKNP